MGFYEQQLERQRAKSNCRLKFLGKGSGFADLHTSAYFSTLENDLVLIDCPPSTFEKLEEIKLKNYNRFFILITNTLDEHIGGMVDFVNDSYFKLKKRVIILVPSNEVEKYILEFFRAKRNSPTAYMLVTPDQLKSMEWFDSCIPTKYLPELENQCFGYSFVLNGKNIIYTGATSTLEPFKPYLKDDTSLYVDTFVSSKNYHLKLEDNLQELISFTTRGIKVFLIHLDSSSAAKKIVCDLPNIKVMDESDDIMDASSAIIYGLNTKPFLGSWGIRFSEHSLTKCKNLLVRMPGESEEDLIQKCNEIKNNFRKVDIKDGDRVTIWVDGAGNVFAIQGSSRLIIDVTDNFLPKKDGEFNFKFY